MKKEVSIKNIMTAINFPKNTETELKRNEDGTFSFDYKIAEKIAITAVANVDNAIIKAMYQVYKDTDVSKIFVLDMGQFERFLREMLPKWWEETTMFKKEDLKKAKGDALICLSVAGKKGDIRVDYKPYIGRKVSVAHSQTKNPKGETVVGRLVEVLTNDGIDTLIISDGHDLKWIVAENVIEFRTL